MPQEKRRILLEMGMIGDLIICGGSLLLTSAIFYRPLWDQEIFLLHHALWQLLITALLALAWHYSMFAAGAYRSYRMSSFQEQAAALAVGSTWVVFWAGCWLCVSKWQLPGSAKSFALELLTFWIFTFSLFLIARVAARVVTHFFRKRGRNLRNVLIVGTNRRAVALADDLNEQHSYGYRLVGFIDDHWHFDGAPEHYKEMLLGQSADMLDHLRNRAIDEIMIALPIASNYKLAQQMIEWCHEQGIIVHYESKLFDCQETVLPKWREPFELLTVTQTGHSAQSLIAKRAIDVVVSSIALLLLSPVLFAIAIAIRLTSTGPVFFKQERLGLGKRHFAIYKFRTMVVDAEKLMARVEHLNQSKGPTFKLVNDPRITPLGSFLRKTSLDELPQLINVWLGDMSLVGPRPLPLRDYRGFSEDWHRRRFSVKPGITCLWQVTGRSSIGFDRWMELDIDYIDRWSLWLDLKILLQTIPAVVRGSGAM
jgi:exopolysaccharide biosynthesis polyprenyl glycosylphosphotransferase